MSSSCVLFGRGYLFLGSPLAAVDAVVQSQIFSECICRLLAEKTVVLVTHSTDIIASGYANVLVLVEDGSLTVTRRDISCNRSLYGLVGTSCSKEADLTSTEEKCTSKNEKDGVLTINEEREEAVYPSKCSQIT